MTSAKDRLPPLLQKPLPGFSGESQGNENLWKHREMVMHALQFRPWFAEQKGEMGIVDLTMDEPQMIRVNPQDFRVQPPSDKKLRGIVVVTGSLAYEDHETVVRQATHKFAGMLFPHDSRLMILEKKVEGVEVDFNDRKAMLHEMGAVDINSLKQAVDGFYLHESRLPTRRKDREPVNLLANEKRLPYYRRLYAEMRRNYAKTGYKLVGWQNLVNELKGTLMPPSAIEALKNGYGVELEVNCGCRWDVDLAGETRRSHECGDAGCQGHPVVAEEEEQEQKQYVLWKKTDLDVHCFDCNANVQQYVRFEGKDKRGKAKIQIDHSCPHCGTIGTAKIKVDPDQLDWSHAPEGERQ